MPEQLPAGGIKREEAKPGAEKDDAPSRRQVVGVYPVM